MQTSGQLSGARAGGTRGAPALVQASRYTPLPAPAIHVRQRRESFTDWLHREFKEGGALTEYLRREKATGLQRRRKLANRMQHFEQNNKSELKLRCVLPRREFMRLKLMDPHFFEDDQNLKNLIRDNPEVAPWSKK